MDVEAAIADAERVIRARFPRLDRLTGYRSDDTRPGGWTIVARLSVWHVLGITVYLVAVNGETGERRIVDGWYPDQPYELRNVCPAHLKGPHPLRPMPERRAER